MQFMQMITQTKSVLFMVSKHSLLIKIDWRFMWAIIITWPPMLLKVLNQNTCCSDQINHEPQRIFLFLISQILNLLKITGTTEPNICMNGSPKWFLIWSDIWQPWEIIVSDWLNIEKLLRNHRPVGFMNHLWMILWKYYSLFPITFLHNLG